MDFPQSVSLTITNACNLRCQMCGQWSEEGYIRGGRERLKREMALADWKRVVDEVADHGISSVLLRGGEPFLFPPIVELLEHIHSKGIFVSIDTNGTQLKKVAADIVRIGDIHLTISLDGPREIHDRVRGVEGCFDQIAEGLARLREFEEREGREISKSATFTISPYSVEGLGRMPDVVRSVGIGTVTIIPYYYVPEALGKEYERQLREDLGCSAFSWRGFHHEESGVDFEVFLAQYRAYLDSLGDVYSYPYLPLSQEEYRTWFTDPVAPVRSTDCTNVEKLVDIQPQGDANFCVDFPDYTIGNVKESTIEELWNGQLAERFREYRRQRPLAVCHRCGAKYMSQIEG